MDKVILKAAGNAYEGWQKVRINRSLTAMAGTFDLELTWQFQGDVKGYDDFIDGLLTGSECTVDIGKDRLITGYLDDFIPSYDDETITINVTGRDKTADLVDCSVVQQSGQFKNQSLLQIAVIVSAPFGISVINETDVGAAFQRVQVEQGETAGEFLTRLAQQRGVLLTTNGLGQLVITRASKKRGEVALKLGVNIKAGRGRFSRKQRFSEYIVKATGGAGWEDDQPLENVGGIKSTITDQDVKRYRPLIIVNDEVTTAAGASLRGQWERQRAISASNTAEYTLTGWRNPNTGNLYQINRIVPVTDDIMGINKDMLISDILYSEDNDTGRLVVLSVVDPDALNIPAVAEKSTTISKSW
ncbi:MULTISPECIES: phage baseplate assembly protein [Marinomonas]|uniref:Contractile injection system protein, VgrG/Pvc8 family n=1 Tax=Marinomonas rhodophyticola TaxID=2992803 RepID=A0ABT3KCL2_9GAMM|nr:contractile injection system protein, VgrG/Pvc8 family [Marinomonas sp. KJ51-3]MCW4628288.1 contractile injection system protein, VgrG/Pvc8 family [Marinomonas sp. KJ51-3]